VSLLRKSIEVVLGITMSDCGEFYFPNANEDMTQLSTSNAGRESVKVIDRSSSPSQSSMNLISKTRGAEVGEVVT
jgi:hypothetical protein